MPATFGERDQTDRWRPYEALDLAAPDALLAAAARDAVPHEIRHHEPALHARHLAALWGVPLPVAGRATLFYAGRAPLANDAPAPPTGTAPTPVLVVVPADRKVGAPRLRDLLRVAELRVLRADRGVGRVGWWGLPGAPGALPAIPGLFGARLLLDALVREHPRVVLALGAGRSWALAPADLLRLTAGHMVDVAGRTRLRS